MKYLEIKSNKAYFKLNDEMEFKIIDTISKNDIYILIKILIQNDKEFEMDEYKDELLGNKAHNIIYRNLFQKFNELRIEKDNIIDTSNQLFEEAYSKYEK